MSQFVVTQTVVYTVIVEADGPSQAHRRAAVIPFREWEPSFAPFVVAPAPPEIDDRARI